MKWDCGPTWSDHVKAMAKWHPYFTWLPTRIAPHDCRWLEWVERRGEFFNYVEYSYWQWEYRIPGGGQEASRARQRRQTRLAVRTMNILGIGFLSESSACIVQDGKLVAAISEERLNRTKNWFGVPDLAVKECLKIAGLKIEDIDYVATHGLCYPTHDFDAFQRHKDKIAASNLTETRKQELFAFLDQRYTHETRVFTRRTPDYLAEIAKLNRPMKIYGHHHCHAASAYYWSRHSGCVVLTADGWGEDGSHTLWFCDEHGMRMVDRSSTIDSLGYFYGSVTKSLGFKPHQHEGKVLGLAAHCENPQSYDKIAGMVSHGEKQFFGNMEGGLYVPHYDNLPLLRLVRDYPPEDIAASAQRRLEEVVCGYISERWRWPRELAVAGGIFANVKLNQRIAELHNVKVLHIFPNMGDGGLSVGAAWIAHKELTKTWPEKPQSMYLGPDVNDAEQALSQLGLPFMRSKDIAADVARLLADGEVVARVTGRMEFGPRALGHRSILCHATDPSINDRLNKKLHRSEFMPFAPATLYDAAHLMYEDWVGGEGQYMTRTYDCTDWMKMEAAAAVHVDGTARPQIVDEYSAPDLYAILSEYRRLTGYSSIINTSFNMHEEPIVCTAEDAIRAFLSSRLNHLAIGDILVSVEDRAATTDLQEAA